MWAGRGWEGASLRKDLQEGEDKPLGLLGRASWTEGKSLNVCGPVRNVLEWGG